MVCARNGVAFGQYIFYNRPLSNSALILATLYNSKIANIFFKVLENHNFKASIS